jgi:hypothetical protein
MKLPSEKKLEVVSAVIGLLANEYTLVTLRQHALEVSQIPDLAVVKPRLLEQRSSYRMAPGPHP